MQKFKAFLRKFFLIHDSPLKVAGGAALGIFLGMVPGEGVISTLVLASIFRLNRLAATAGVLASNMWTTLIILPPAALVGGFLFGENYMDLVNIFKDNYHLGWEFFISEIALLKFALPLLVGFFIVAGLIAVIFFFIIYLALKKGKISFIKKTA